MLDLFTPRRATVVYCSCAGDPIPDWEIESRCHTDGQAYEHCLRISGASEREETLTVIVCP
jgi:hypothetical protein